MKLWDVYKTVVNYNSQLWNDREDSILEKYFENYNPSKNLSCRLHGFTRRRGLSPCFRTWLLKMTDSPRLLTTGPLALLIITHQTEYCSRDSWFLNIRGVQESDAGKYICQLNTERPISISGTLSVVGNHKTQTAKEKLNYFILCVCTCHLTLLNVIIVV